MVTISHIYNNESGLDVRVKINSAFDALYSSGASIIEDTYVNIQTLVSSDSLTPGNLYKITDRADLGIILLAVSTNKFALEGEGIFLNPDFQGIGDYSDVAGYTDTQGVWALANEGGYTGGGTVVFWDGEHYRFEGGGASGSPDVSPDYTAYPKSLQVAGNAVGYIEEVDFILYDFDNDKIIRRMDKRENEVNLDSAISVFQWGNDSVSKNKVYSSGVLRCINQRGTVNRLDVSKQATVTASETHVSDLSNCIYKGRAIYNCSMITGEMKSCEVECPIDNILVNYTFDPDYSHVLKQLNSSGSNFEAELDMTDGIDYDLASETLTIPINMNYIGIVNLAGNTGQTINKIVNLPSPFEVEFRIKNIGFTQDFEITAIATAIANQLVGDTVGATVVKGNNGTAPGDHVRFRKEQGMNVRTTGSILA